jgi:hypothetical protein
MRTDQRIRGQFAIWNIQKGYNCITRSLYRLLLDNGELWNFKSMLVMQAEKAESAIFSNFKSHLIDHANNKV